MFRSFNFKSLLLGLSFIAFYACTPGSSETSNITKSFSFEEVLPSELGMSSDSLDKIDWLMRTAVESKWIPGGAAIVAKSGKVIYKKAWGYSEIESESPMSTESIFRIASMTKPITSLAILQLAEEGKLNFNDPVSKFIPEFAKPMVLESINPTDSSFTAVPAKNELTIHHLLTHTSGISYGFADTLMNKIYSKFKIVDLTTLKPLTIEENIQVLANLPLKHEPGEAFSYGLSIDVLGRVIEVASGMDLATYFRTKIFDPLGMNDTYFYLPEDKAGRLTKMYQNNQETPLIPFPHRPDLNMTGDFPIEGAKTYYSGGGGLSSTMEDYLRFCQAIMNGGYLGENRIISEEYLKHASENKIGDLRIGRNKFTYGFMLTPENGDLRFGRVPGRLSWGGAFQTTFWIDPQREIIGILMTQVYPSYHQNKLYEGFEAAVNSAFIPN